MGEDSGKQKPSLTAMMISNSLSQTRLTFTNTKPKKKSFHRANFKIHTSYNSKVKIMANKFSLKAMVISNSLPQTGYHKIP